MGGRFSRLLGKRKGGKRKLYNPAIVVEFKNKFSKTEIRWI